MALPSQTKIVVMMANAMPLAMSTTDATLLGSPGQGSSQDKLGVHAVPPVSGCTPESVRACWKRACEKDSGPTPLSPL